MYHWIVRQKVRRGFRQLSAGDSEAVLRQFAADAVFSFSGRHSLSGEHRGAATVRLWFERLYRLFPGIRFEVLDVLSTGWPWNTVAATHFSVRVKLRDGQAYHNQGMQYLRLRWGKVVEDRIYEDTQKLAAELQHMAQQGVGEALYAPLASAH
jgi:ketosteroid isomerase-like protein